MLSSTGHGHYRVKTAQKMYCVQEMSRYRKYCKIPVISPGLRGRLHDEVQPGLKFQPVPRAEILLRLHAWFQPGLKFEIARKSERPPSCFVENTIFEHAQAHFSARAEILMRLHEAFMNFSPGWKSQPGFTNRAGLEISARDEILSM